MKNSKNFILLFLTIFLIPFTACNDTTNEPSVTSTQKSVLETVKTPEITETKPINSQNIELKDYQGYIDYADKNYIPSEDDTKLKKILDGLTGNLEIISNSVYNYTLPDSVDSGESVNVIFYHENQAEQTVEKFYPLSGFPFSNYEEIKSFIFDTFSKNAGDYYLRRFAKCEVLSRSEDGTYTVKPVDGGESLSNCPYIEADGRLMLNSGAGGSGVGVGSTFKYVHVTSKSDTRIEFSYLVYSPFYHYGQSEPICESCKGAVVKEDSQWKLDWNGTSIDYEYTNFEENWGNGSSNQDVREKTEPSTDTSAPTAITYKMTAEDEEVKKIIEGIYGDADNFINHVASPYEYIDYETMGIENPESGISGSKDEFLFYTDKNDYESKNEIECFSYVPLSIPGISSCEDLKNRMLTCFTETVADDWLGWHTAKCEKLEENGKSFLVKLTEGDSIRKDFIELDGKLYAPFGERMNIFYLDIIKVIERTENKIKFVYPQFAADSSLYTVEGVLEYENGWKFGWYCIVSLDPWEGDFNFSTAAQGAS